jgi:hypothetical protein
VKFVQRSIICPEKNKTVTRSVLTKKRYKQLRCILGVFRGNE